MSALLENYKTTDFPIEKEVVEIEGSACAWDAISLLVKNSVTSIPVKGESGYVGFVDCLDIVCFINSFISSSSANWKSMKIKSLLKEEPVRNVVNFAGRYPFKPIPEGSGLFEVLSEMKAGASRVPIVNSSGQVVKIISQSTILKQLGLHIHELNKDIVQSTISELKLGANSIEGVRVHDMTTAAISLMATKKLNAIGVFMEDGHLLTNISTSDICIAIVHDYDLHQSVQSFITAVRTKFVFLKRQGRDFPAAVTVNPDSSIKNLILKLAATGLHRLYVTDIHTNAPMGVVALADIISLVI